MTSAELFAAMPRELGGEILDHAHETEKPLYRAALDAVAQSRKVRPVFLERQPRAQRQQTLIESLSRPALNVAADGLLRHWLLKKQAAVLTDFLDALGIKHDQGVVEQLPKNVEDNALKSAVDALLSKHPAAVVAIYLHAFNAMNGESWTNLDTITREDPRLRFQPAPAAG